MSLPGSWGVESQPDYAILLSHVSYRVATAPVQFVPLAAGGLHELAFPFGHSRIGRRGPVHD